MLRAAASLSATDRRLVRLRHVTGGRLGCACEDMILMVMVILVVVVVVGQWVQAAI